MLDVRQDFNLQNEVYLDTAATSKTPKQVVAAMADYYTNYRATVHKGVYKKSQKATQMYELSRQKIGQFIGAAAAAEVIFTRNCTESINLVAQTWGRQNLRRGDKIVLTIAEHHSNILPWRQLRQDIGCKIEYVNLTKDFRLDLKDLSKKSANAKFLAITHASNVLGTVNVYSRILKNLRIANSSLTILIDGTQAVGHIPVDVQELGCDFYAFSGHKMYGPTGIGALWGRGELLIKMPPYQTGGEMNKTVDLSGEIWNVPPWKFEAGTPNIAGAIGLGAAVDWLRSVGVDNIVRHETELIKYALERICKISKLTIYGPKEVKNRLGIFSFAGRSVEPVKLAERLDQENISIRSGNLCAQPLLNYLGVRGLVRASIGVYTSKEDIDKLIAALDAMV